MGSLSAADFAAHAPLHDALSWHITANHYPPLPRAYVDLAEDVVTRANRGLCEGRDWEDIADEIVLLSREVLTSPVLPRDTVESVLGLGITIGDAVRVLHLDPFIDSEA